MYNNYNISDQFNSIDLNIDLNEYKRVKIICITYEIYITEIEFIPEINKVYACIFYAEGSIRNRKFKVNSDYTITVFDATFWHMTAGIGIDNNFLIPYQIIGYNK